jgi:hypothetical protein
VPRRRVRRAASERSRVGRAPTRASSERRTSPRSVRARARSTSPATALRSQRCSPSMRPRSEARRRSRRNR